MELKMNTKQQSQPNKQDPNQSLKPKAKRVSRRGWGRIILLSSVTLGAAFLLTALHLLAPTIPGRAETFPARVSWYLTHGQWRPDSRTFAAAWNYYLQQEDDARNAPT